MDKNREHSKASASKSVILSLKGKCAIDGLHPVRSRYERKKPEHLQAPALELDLDFHQIIELVT